MEDLLVDKERQWVVVSPSTKPTAMSQEDWEMIYIKENSMIHLSISDLVLINSYGEGNVNKLWDSLGNLY